jgi:hypothetical protein
MGSAIVHSYYTPTKALEDFEVVARALKSSHQVESASGRWILYMYIFLISRSSSTVYYLWLLFIVMEDYTYVGTELSGDPDLALPEGSH